jgi:hypothetical protein
LRKTAQAEFHSTTNRFPFVGSPFCLLGQPACQRYKRFRTLGKNLKRDMPKPIGLLKVLSGTIKLL